jgi:hypothetical protein
MDDQAAGDPMAEQVLDGNAVAGRLMAALGVDLTGVPGSCATCGVVSMVGELRAYVRAPGAVLRCPACSSVVLRIVETPTRTYIDLSGAAHLRFEHPADG